MTTYQPISVVKVYDDETAAERARQALLDAGFERERLQLSVQGDEAGALEGNFVAGNPKIGDAADGAYGPNYEHVVHPSTYVLAVATDTLGEPQATALMVAFGGLDIDDLVRGRRARGLGA